MRTAFSGPFNLQTESSLSFSLVPRKSGENDDHNHFYTSFVPSGNGHVEVGGF